MGLNAIPDTAIFTCAVCRCHGTDCSMAATLCVSLVDKGHGAGQASNLAPWLSVQHWPLVKLKGSLPRRTVKRGQQHGKE